MRSSSRLQHFQLGDRTQAQHGRADAQFGAAPRARWRCGRRWSAAGCAGPRSTGPRSWSYHHTWPCMSARRPTRPGGSSCAWALPAAKAASRQAACANQARIPLGNVMRLMPLATARRGPSMTRCHVKTCFAAVGPRPRPANERRTGRMRPGSPALGSHRRSQEPHSEPRQTGPACPSSRRKGPLNKLSRAPAAARHEMR